MLIDIDMPWHSITERNRFSLGTRRRKAKRDDQPSTAVAILSLLFAAVKFPVAARGRRVHVNGDEETGQTFPAYERKILRAAFDDCRAKSSFANDRDVVM